MDASIPYYPEPYPMCMVSCDPPYPECHHTKKADTRTFPIIPTLSVRGNVLRPTMNINNHINNEPSSKRMATSIQPPPRALLNSSQHMIPKTCPRTNYCTLEPWYPIRTSTPWWNITKAEGVRNTKSLK